jgi:hypothetical protein
MSFLDRFKPQPRWKHADPAVRAAAVPEMPDDDEHRAVVAELAKGDDDVRVRRAAVARLSDASSLAELARSEPDADLRREIADRLVAIATAPADTDAEAALALTGLDDPRQFATIAKSSPHDTVRSAALGRVHDPRALSSVARHAVDPQTALDAVARLADGAELLNIAVRTDHREAGIAALEKCLSDDGMDEAAARETLDGVIARAKNKSVSRRARAMLQAIQEAEAARRMALEQWQQRVAAVVARTEAISANPSLPNAARELADAEAEWREVAASGTFELDSDTAGRFGALVESAQAGIAAHERAEAERRAAAEHAAALQAVRISLCERLENATAEKALEVLETARLEWADLPELSAEDAADRQLEARFTGASRLAVERHENFQDRVRIGARLAELSMDAERLSSEEHDSEGSWTAVQAEWASLHRKADTLDPAVAERYATADARVRMRAEERRSAAERAIRLQVQRIEQLVDRAVGRAAAEDLTLREADRLARELRAAMDAPQVPETEQQALLERLKAAYGEIAPKVHELRELDEWKRFANAAVQEELIARTEALRAKYGFDTPEGVKPEDLDKVARELHEIQERWKQAAEAPRTQAQALWHRYRQAADPVQTKVREFFAQRVEERKGNLDRKLALIERAEALSASTDWIKTAEELKQLQAEWQAVGPVPKQETRATWKRFREACDAFFTRRNADLALRKETWAVNQARKEALCARAEEFAASREWDKGAAEIRRLQAEWKTVGPVRRTRSEALWQRFRLACDTFFDRYKRRDEIELEARQADREALVTELEGLAPGAMGAPAGTDSGMIAPDAMGEIAAPPAYPVDNAALLERVRSLRTRWNQSSPTVRHGADPLSGRFMQALEHLIAAYPQAFVGTELDTDANRRKMEKLCERVEGFLQDVAAAPSSSQALATMLREALASNTIGGRAGEETKWRAMADDVRNAQAAWARLGPAPGDAGRQLSDRFHRACSRFFEQLRRHVPQNVSQPQRGKPVGVR